MILMDVYDTVRISVASIGLQVALSIVTKDIYSVYILSVLYIYIYIYLLE